MNLLPWFLKLDVKPLDLLLDSCLKSITHTWSFQRFLDENMKKLVRKGLDSVVFNVSNSSIKL